jgi:hypothetical protein
MEGVDMRACLALALCGTILASSARAVDGVKEINQACASGSGCFAGDGAGFPVQILTAGSYRLTSNLTPPDQNTSVIVIGVAPGGSTNAFGVSVDLNGFAIQGTNTTRPCSAPGNGRGVTSSERATVVSNGHVRGMGSTGVELTNVSARVENVIVEQNCGDGILVGNASLVIEAISRFNTGQGINAGATSQILGSVADQNGANGIYAQNGASLVTNCTANANGFSGVNMGTQFSSLVTDTVANINGQHGIVVDADSLVLRSTTNNNGINGVTAENLTSGLGFLTSNGNPSAAVSGFTSVLGCSVLAGALSCPP